MSMSISSRESTTFGGARQIILFTMISLACNLDYGYSSTIYNTAVDQFEDYMNVSITKRSGNPMTQQTYNWSWDLILNIWFVGYFIGIVLGAFVNDRFGRKIGYLIGCTMALIGASSRFLGIILWIPELLFVGRLIISICTAINYQSCILYIQECSPTHMRGFCTFLCEISYAVMCLVGAFAGTEQLLGNHLAWLLGIPIPCCLLSIVAIFFCHETPKYLLLVDKDRKKAIDSVRFYHGDGADVDDVLTEIQQEAKGEDYEPNMLVLVKEIICEPHLRKAYFLSVAALENTLPLWPILFSSTYYLKSVDIEDNIAEWSSTIMMATYVLGSMAGGALIERLGRRTLNLVCATCVNSLLLVFVICSQLQPVCDPIKYGCLFSVIAFSFCYGCGVGPIAWFISAELVPQRYRSIAQSLSYATNSLVVVPTTFTIMPLYKAIGSWAFLIMYIVPNSLCVIYLYKYLPETKGREIHDIVDDLKGEIPADKHNNQC